MHYRMFDPLNRQFEPVKPVGSAGGTAATVGLRTDVGG